MREIHPGLEDSQQGLHRVPNTRLVFRDVMPRFVRFGSSASALSAPDAEGVEQNLSDMHSAMGEHFSATCVEDDELQVTRIRNDLVFSTKNYAIDEKHHPSVHGYHTHFVYDGDVYRVAGTSDARKLVDLDLPDYAEHTSVTAGSGVYTSTLVVRGSHKWLVFSRNGTMCPHTVIVDDGFNQSSNQWVASASLRPGEEVFIFNARQHGYAMFMRWKDGIWSDPRPLIRLDDISSNSFLRISSLTNIPDIAGNPVLWAAGRIGRGVTDSMHPQAFDLIMRSKDGVHWTLDRYCYITDEAVAGSLYYQPGIGDETDYLFYVNWPTLYVAHATWLAGADHSSIKREVPSGDCDDVLSWTLQLPEAGAAAAGAVSLPANQGTFNKHTETESLGRWMSNTDQLAITPGLWLWRYAGYGDQEALVSIEGVDQTPGSYGLASRDFSIRNRDIIMRSLYDWASDQNWQLLSQVKNYDECTEMKRLYSVSSGQIEVRKDEDAEQKGDVAENELVEAAGQLVYRTPNKVSINFCTKPADTQDFQVKVRWSISDDNPITSGLATGYTPARIAEWEGGQFGDDGNPYFQFSIGTHHRWWAADEEDSRFAVSVTNTDGTVSWAYLGHYRAYDQIYVRKGAAHDSDPGWNGSEVPTAFLGGPVVADKYRVWRTSERCSNPMGTGVGVCGCATDQYNLIAAVPDLKSKVFVLWIRRGDEDESAWVPWAIEPFASGHAPSEDHTYETFMYRRGRRIIAGLFTFPREDADRQLVAAITDDWPLDEPMVVLTDDAYNKTDRGKVGVVCSIAVPASELGPCKSESEFLPRNPDLFERTAELSGKDYQDNDYEDFPVDYDIYTWLPYFTGGYHDNLVRSPRDRASIPPFHFGGEVYHPVEDDPDYGATDFFGQQNNFMGEDTTEEDGTVQIHSAFPKWRRLRVSLSPYCARYERASAGGYSQPKSPIAGDRFALAVMPRFYSRYVGDDEGVRTHPVWYEADEDEEYYPMVAIGDPSDTKDRFGNVHPYQGAMSGWWEPAVFHLGRSFNRDALGFEEADWDRFYFVQRDWYRMGGHHDITEEERFPNFTIYPGFYFPGRAGPENLKSPHPKGTIIRQHWSPELELKGVWSYDDEHDKTLEWVMKDIAYKAGVTDFDTRHSIDMSGTLMGIFLDTISTSEKLLLQNTMGSTVRQKDFDITIKLDENPGDGARGIGLLFRASNTSGYPTSGAVVRVIRRQGRPMIMRLHEKVYGSSWVLKDEISSISAALGSTIRFVCHREFISAYVNGMHIGTMCLSPNPGLHMRGYISVIAFGGVNMAFTARQPELYAWTDGIILDTRQNAINGLQRCLRDRRIKFVPTIIDGLPVLRVSYMSLPYTTSNIHTYDHYLGVITDHNLNEEGVPSGSKRVSILRDSGGETDRIPTHIRVVGYEIGDYIDHEVARRFGLLFASQHVPNLEEEEAYEEAGRIVREAASYSESRAPVVAAQLHWEPEDALRLIYRPYDGGPTIDGFYIVDSIAMSYEQTPAFQATARLRKMK